MNYYVFLVSDREFNGSVKEGIEFFEELVIDRNIWGIGGRTPNRNQVESGDKAVFYITGQGNQVFVGTATLDSGAYESDADSFDLRIDLKDVRRFDEPRPRSSFQGIEWRPTPSGISRISEHDYKIITGTLPDRDEFNPTTDDRMEFAMEKYLEDFMVKNWDMIDFGENLDIYEDENGNTGKQYYTDIGYIDILTADEEGNFTVIELKKGRESDKVVGQVLRYMSWVRRNLIDDGQEVNGLIIVHEKDERLEHAVSEVSNKVSVKRYEVNFDINDY